MNKNQKPKNESRLKMNWKRNGHTKGKWVVNPYWSYKKGVSAKDTTKNKPDGYSVDANIERKTLGGQDSPYSIAIARMQTYSNGNRPMDEVEANARLIASAPDMLEALKNAKNCLRNHCENRGSDESKLSGWELDAYEIVKSAINKAEGK